MQRELREKPNVVFIGMPGSGKSTLGELTAERLGWDFFDTDWMIEQKTGRKICEIFRHDGEETFRRLETDAILECCKKRRVVIATGGGAVTRPENMAMLAETGRLIYLERPLELLAAANHSDRPLLAGESNRLICLYTQRKSLYEGYANFIVANDCSLERVVDRIIREFSEGEHRDGTNECEIQ